MKNTSNTRDKLLTVAFETFYTNGYSATGLNTILDIAGVQKGSLYHFFSSKKELALAVINEKIAERFAERYTAIVISEQPLHTLFTFISNPANFDLKRGCPLGKLVQELAGLDDDFRTALAKAYISYEGYIEQALLKAMAIGELKQGDAKKLATFIVSVIGGAIQRAKLSDNEELFIDSIELLKKYISHLD
ncbi:TetR/AcrR family transcriptional regulator [Beggiatoa leptomitoformis]|nr:TetR/AcrR family transcriptional regulator [Beggiatoa leptomitoformis]